MHILCYLSLTHTLIVKCTVVVTENKTESEKNLKNQNFNVLEVDRMDKVNEQLYEPE